MLQNLQFTGIGAGFNPEMDNTSAYFTHNGQLILIDCGETVFARLFKSGLLQQYTKVYLLLTHTHADHAGSLPALVSFCHAVLHYKITVVHPQIQQVQTLCQIMGVGPEEYAVCSTLPKDAGFSCQFIPVQHVPDMNCYGLHIAIPSWNLYYSGDAAQIPEDILTHFLNGTIQSMYQDTSIHPSTHHAGLAYLCSIIPPEHRNRMFCMHLAQGAAEKIIQEGFRIPEVLP